MLKLTNVTKTFNKGTVNEKPALRGVNLDLADGDFVTVIGGNGAGKSMLLNIVAGVFPPDGGTIELGGKDVSRLPEYKRAANLGRVFQDPMRGTAADMQIDENLVLAARRGQHRGLAWGIGKADRESYVDRRRELDLGLETHMTSKVGLLSGGQRQAPTLLMAVLRKPKLEVADLLKKSEEVSGGELANDRMLLSQSFPFTDCNKEPLPFLQRTGEALSFMTQ